jgi:hypothetical protein
VDIRNRSARCAHDRSRTARRRSNSPVCASTCAALLGDGGARGDEPGCLAQCHHPRSGPARATPSAHRGGSRGPWGPLSCSRSSASSLTPPSAGKGSRCFTRGAALGERRPDDERRVWPRLGSTGLRSRSSRRNGERGADQPAAAKPDPKTIPQGGEQGVCVDARLQEGPAQTGRRSVAEAPARCDRSAVTGQPGRRRMTMSDRSTTHGRTAA